MKRGRMVNLSTDVLIVGAGGAGLRAAIAAQAAGSHTLIVTKGRLGRAGVTPMATSDFMAYSAAIGHADPLDTPEQHARDIVTMGAYVCDANLARVIAEEAPARLYDLLEWGAQFKETAPGKLYQFLTDGSSRARACGKGPDTSWEIERVLVQKCHGIPRLEHTMITRLLVSDGRVAGAVAINQKTGESLAIEAKAVILASGGAGAAFRLHVFPGDATGDGYALAYRAGAELVNMEFIQIIPSVIHPFKFCASGVFWRTNPRLRNGRGEEFLSRYMPAGIDVPEALHIKGVTAPFSVRNNSRFIDIGIFEEVMAGRGTPHGGVYIDLSHNPSEMVEREAGEPLKWLQRYGIDIRKQPVEVADAIQHFNGGVRINERAETAVPGLYAAGEAAGAQHGADRPGGNALADCQVFGCRAGVNAAYFAREAGPATWPDEEAKSELAHIGDLKGRAGGRDPRYVREWLQDLMWKNASVVRRVDGLERALSQLKSRAGALAELGGTTPNELCRALELENMFIVSEMVLRAAVTRTESRGPHCRGDYPDRDDANWIKYLVFRQSAGEMKMTTAKPVPD